MATSKVLKPRRGSTTEHATFKGQAFEITFDTDKKTIVAHDGLTMGGFPLAHESAVAETDSSLRALIEEKVSEVEGVSSGELRALDSALRGLINNNAQQQAIRDADQDNVITVLDSTLRALIAEEAANNQSSMEAIRALIADIGGEAEAAKNSVPVGSLIMHAAGATPPGGFLFCNGAAVSRTTYAKLFEVIGVQFGQGDGKTTFNIPNCDSRFIEGGGAPGWIYESGLPEIYAWWAGAYESSSEIPGGATGWGAGAVKTEADGYNRIELPGTAGYGKMNYNFRASYHNSIYSASDKVQPPAITMCFFIKY